MTRAVLAVCATILAGCLSRSSSDALRITDPLPGLPARRWVFVDRRPLIGGAGGLCVHAGALWHSFSDSEGKSRMYEIHPETLDPRGKYPLPDGHMTGLATDGRRFWQVDTGHGVILGIDPPATVRTTIPVPGAPTGIAWDGKQLWFADMEGSFLAAWDTDRARVVRTIVLPNRRLTSVLWDGELLWAGDLNIQSLVAVDPARSVIVEILRLDRGEHPSGTAFDGTILWIATMEGNVLRYRRNH